jgi:hypothetical protein
VLAAIAAGLIAVVPIAQARCVYRSARAFIAHHGRACGSPPFATIRSARPPAREHDRLRLAGKDAAGAASGQSKSFVAAPWRGLGRRILVRRSTLAAADLRRRNQRSGASLVSSSDRTARRTRRHRRAVRSLYPPARQGQLHYPRMENRQMKRTLTIALLAASAALPAMVSAQDKPAAKPPAMQPGGRAGDGHDERQTWRRCRSACDSCSSMDRLRQTKDPAERQKLLDEHMKAMDEQMAMMRGMGGG